ncbi:MAG: UDP-3-O-(3-hydroxymyristoyl)glucosamine N-acyltransferase [Desulfobacteraceae bacterium]|nr:UDP-3-O-(3-hydroxymyristoyl)glucosamine N-acyltransferase [Desulfobacteraceae bacterium]
MGVEESLSRLAEMVDGELLGDSGVRVRGVNELAAAGEEEITFITHPRLATEAAASRAAAVIVPRGVELPGKPAIRVKDPYLAVAVIHNHFLHRPFAAAGIHPRAHVGPECRVPAEVSIGPSAVLGTGVVLGKRVTVGPGTVIGDHAFIGDDCVLHANVTIYAHSRLGRRVIVHSGAVIGSDGFGYATDDRGRHVKRPHVGSVEIEDDVEIGANVCIDRGTFGKTVVREGAKIDNLVQLAHNVVVGERSLLVSQVGIAGSTTLGRGVVLGGQVGVAGHLELGDRVMVGAKSGVHNSQQPGAVISGIPAIAHKKWLLAVSAFQKMPELIKEIRTLRKKVAGLLQEHPAGEPDAE